MKQTSNSKISPISTIWLYKHQLLAFLFLKVEDIFFDLLILLKILNNINDCSEILTFSLRVGKYTIRNLSLFNVTFYRILLLLYFRKQTYYYLTTIIPELLKAENFIVFRINFNSLC